MAPSALDNRSDFTYSLCLKWYIELQFVPRQTLLPSERVSHAASTSPIPVEARVNWDEAERKRPMRRGRRILGTSLVECLLCSA